MLETKVVQYLKVYFKDFCQQVGHFLINEIVAMPVGIHTSNFMPIFYILLAKVKLSVLITARQDD